MKQECLGCFSSYCVLATATGRPIIAGTCLFVVWRVLKAPWAQAQEKLFIPGGDTGELRRPASVRVCTGPLHPWHLDSIRLVPERKDCPSRS
jgi:hypothetical protein